MYVTHGSSDPLADALDSAAEASLLSEALGDARVEAPSTDELRRFWYLEPAPTQIKFVKLVDQQFIFLCQAVIMTIIPMICLNW